jgi:hypothetical protein
MGTALVTRPGELASWRGLYIKRSVVPLDPWSTLPVAGRRFHNRGRDARYRAPSAQIRTGGFPAYGSHLGCLTAKRRFAASRTRASAWVTLAQICARCVSCRLAFPSAPARRSTGSAAGRPALFARFRATTAGSDFSRRFISGYGSSPSRSGPARQVPSGRSRDLPGSGTIPLRVMGSSTTAERRRLA